MAKWTTAKEGRFLAALAETCNVADSARRAKLGNSTVYEHRRDDATFRDGWAKAIAQGYARLELETLERALNGTVRTIKLPDGSEERRVEHDPRTALTLLRMHRDTAEVSAKIEHQDAEMSEEEVEELKARIVEKLMRLREQTTPDGEDIA